MTAATHTLPIAVIGGGLTGKMMALTLLQSGYDVHLFAPDPSSRPADGRSTTIHAGGYQMLSVLGVIEQLATPPIPISQISVAMGREKKGQSDWLLHWSEAETPLAYVVMNEALDGALDTALASFTGEADFTHHRTAITACEMAGEEAQLSDEDGTIYKAQRVIACDGAKSSIRAMMGITPRALPTGQSAIIANIACQLPHDNRACQRFLDTGPLALMPLAGQEASLVWSTTRADAAYLLNMSDDEFNTALTKAFGLEFGALSLTTARASFPLTPQFVPRYSTGVITLAGDAAHSIHPLAGMGYNLALADAAILVSEIISAKQRGLGPYHLSINQRYQALRQPEIIALTAATSGLNRLLSRSPSLLQSLSATGMILLNKSPLKSYISKAAMTGQLAKAPLFAGKLSA